jgi:hypothetical protein
MEGGLFNEKQDKSLFEGKVVFPVENGFYGVRWALEAKQTHRQLRS